MKVIITKNYEELSKVAANEMAEVVKNIGTPLPYTEIGICAIIVSCKTGTTPNLF